MSAVDEVRDLAEAVARRRALRLWDVEMTGTSGRSVIRVLVDADGGVDLDTVAQVAEEVSRGLDLKDPISGRYTLEVSSPGIERTLRSPEHFELSIGSKVVVKTKDPTPGGSHRIDGVIVAAGPESVTIAPEGSEPVVLEHEVIKSARTVFEWDTSTAKQMSEKS